MSAYDYIVQRETPTDDCTFSEYRDADGTRICDLLEPAVPFPAGRFQVIPYLSPEHGYVVPRYINIPGHTYIEQHPGNASIDTKDCQLPGDSRGPVDLTRNGVTTHYPHGVLNSRKMFVALMQRYGFPDYSVDDTGKIRTALTTPEAVRAFLKANPTAGMFTVDVRNAP